MPAFLAIKNDEVLFSAQLNNPISSSLLEEFPMEYFATAHGLLLPIHGNYETLRVSLLGQVPSVPNNLKRFGGYAVLFDPRCHTIMLISVNDEGELDFRPFSFNGHLVAAVWHDDQAESLNVLMKESDLWGNHLVNAFRELFPKSDFNRRFKTLPLDDIWALADQAVKKWGN